MGSFVVVFVDPAASDFAYLGKEFEHVGIEHLVSEGAVEAFDIRVLIRFAGLDVVEFHALVPAPGGEHAGQVFGAVVDPDCVGFAPPLHEPIECAHHAGTGNGGIHHNRQRFAHALIEDVQRAEAATVIERIGHEVHGPFRIGPSLHHHRLLNPCRQAALGSPRQIELHGLVNAIHPLVIPPVAHQAKAVVAHPESPARVLLHDGVQRFDHFTVPRLGRHHRPVPTRARELHRGTRSGRAQLMPGHQESRRFALLRRPQTFF